MPDVKFAQGIRYNAGEGKARRVALVTDEKDGDVINLAAMDSDGNWTLHEDVPRRSPDDYEAGGGGGHTWYYE